MPPSLAWPHHYGLSSGLCGVGMGFVFSGVLGTGEMIAAVLTVGAGWIGGLEARSTLAGRETFYEATRKMGAAKSPQDVVRIVGERLAGPGVDRVFLWQLLPGTENYVPSAIEVSASWQTGEDEAWPTGLRLEAADVPVLERLRTEAPIRFRSEELSAPERASWEKLGVRSALLVPLASASGGWSALLMASSGTSRRFRGEQARAYATIGPQVTVVLENLRLVERGERVGGLEERQRLSREIHDTLTQGFASIVTHAVPARKALPDDIEAAGTHLEQIERTARENLEEARRVVRRLRPEPLEGAPLPEALARIAGRFSEESDVTVETSVTGEPHPLPPEAEVTLLRVAQEALVNVRKHAGAGRVALTLSYLGDAIALDIRDDGTGFDLQKTAASSPHAHSGGLGLKGMRERVETLGGSLSVESSPVEEITLAVELPATLPTALPTAFDVGSSSGEATGKTPGS